MVLLMGACFWSKAPKECIYPAGDLLFSKDRTGWKDVFVGKEYNDTLLVYNPTSEGIRLEGFNNFPEITCRKIGHTVEDWNLGGYVVEAGTCDTLIMTFCVKNENILGNYYNVMRFIVGGEVNYNYGFMVDVNVREDFDDWSEEEKKQAPRWTMDTTEFDFGTLEEGEEAATVFKVKNTGRPQPDRPQDRNHLWLHGRVTQPTRYPSRQRDRTACYLSFRRAKG